MEYGSAIWIFRIKAAFHYSYPILSKYNVAFSRLENWYHNMAKTILGVDKSTSNTAALVRLGWMPLDYRLAYRACIWYMKIRLGLAGVALFKQFTKLSDPVNDETWAKTGFYRHAHDLILRLDKSLLQTRSIDDFKCRLRLCMFDELSSRWHNCQHAKICHVVHPNWEPVTWTRNIFSRQTCSLYHQIAVGRGKFGDRFKYSSRKNRKSTCKFGCKAESSIYHFLFDCRFCDDDILDLQMICKSKRIEYSVKTLFTEACLQVRVEIFLKKIIDLDF